MADPVSESIISDILTALDGISVQGGDNTTPLSVARLDRFTGDDGDRPALRVEKLSEVWSRGVAQNTFLVDLSVRIQLRLDTQADTVPTEKQLARLAHDCKTAIMGLPAAQPEPLNITEIPFDPDDPVDGGNIDIQFQYTVADDALTTMEAPQ